MNKSEMNKSEIAVKTGIGDIIIYRNSDPAYPGVAVSYVPDGSDGEIDLVRVEQQDSRGGGFLNIYVYGNIFSEDYTNKFTISHRAALRALND